MSVIGKKNFETVVMGNMKKSKQLRQTKSLEFPYLSVNKRKQEVSHILEYADFISSLVLVDQLPASSSIQHPNNLVTDFWSISASPTESFVTKSVLALESIIYEHLLGFSFVRFLSDQSLS